MEQLPERMIRELQTRSEVRRAENEADEFRGVCRCTATVIWSCCARMTGPDGLCNHCREHHVQKPADG